MNSRHELITHIERCRALLRNRREAVHQAILADLVRYLEGRLQAELDASAVIEVV
jgi:hypothetical protein